MTTIKLSFAEQIVPKPEAIKRNELYRMEANYVEWWKATMSQHQYLIQSHAIG